MQGPESRAEGSGNWCRLNECSFERGDWHLQSGSTPRQWKESHLLDNLCNCCLYGRHPLHLLSFTVADIGDRGSNSGQFDGVIPASRLASRADICHLAEVHHTLRLRGCRHISHGKAEQVALLENEPSAPPVLYVLALRKHEASLLRAGPE